MAACLLPLTARVLISYTKETKRDIEWKTTASLHVSSQGCCGEKEMYATTLFEKMHCLDLKLSFLCLAPFALPCTHSELPWTPNICSACRHLQDNNDIVFSDSCHSYCKLSGLVFKQNSLTQVSYAV